MTSIDGKRERRYPMTGQEVDLVISMPDFFARRDRKHAREMLSVMADVTADILTMETEERDRILDESWEDRA